MSATILYEVAGAVARLTLHQPGRLNAITLPMWQALPQLVADACANSDVRVIVLAGADTRAFSAGADISRFGSERQGIAAVQAYDAAVAAAELALELAEKPTLALIQGVCYGGGLGLASACDLRLANASATFRVPAAKLGIGYAPRGMARFVQLMGASATAEMFFAAATYPSQEALALGLINRAYPDADFASAAKAYADTIASHAPLSLAAAKATLRALSMPPFSCDFTQAEALVAKCYDSQDYAEGKLAFAQKRAPNFVGW